MNTLATVLILLVALAHVGFMILETFLFRHSIGQRVFDMSKLEDPLATLAANQGVYNGFLAAGLIWAYWADRADLKLFFLGCVVIAGVVGAATTGKKTILMFQAAPAALAFILVWAA